MKLIIYTENLNDNITNIKSGITNIKNEIDNLPENLDSDMTNIKSDIEIINTNMLQYLNKTVINQKKLDTHTDIINANLARLDKIKYNIDDIYILKIEEVHDLNFTSDINKIQILNVLFNSTKFKMAGYIEVFCQFLFKYPNYNTIGRFALLFQFYDENDDLFNEYTEIQSKQWRQ